MRTFHAGKCYILREYMDGGKQIMDRTAAKMVVGQPRDPFMVGVKRVSPAAVAGAASLIGKENFSICPFARTRRRSSFW
jgi:hypothetical protein